MVLSNNHKQKTNKKNQTNNNTEAICNLYFSKLGTKLIDDKIEEEKVNVYEIKFHSIYRETNSKEMALSFLIFILMLTAYKREEIT